MDGVDQVVDIVCSMIIKKLKSSESKASHGFLRKLSTCEISVV